MFLAPFSYVFQICDARTPDNVCPAGLEKLSCSICAINQLLFELTFYSFLRFPHPRPPNQNELGPTSPARKHSLAYPLALRNRLPRTFHVQEFLQSPCEFLEINVQDMNLALQLLDTLRHKQMLNRSVTKKMLELPRVQ